jgi:hypothetical protein
VPVDKILALPATIGGICHIPQIDLADADINQELFGLIKVVRLGLAPK